VGGDRLRLQAAGGHDEVDGADADTWLPRLICAVTV
jgi:hypothetical protein